MPSQLLPPAEKAPVQRSIADCRVYERKTCALPTTCQPASALEMKEMRWAAIIADISQGGVRLLLQRRFEKGTGLAIELPGDGEREPTQVFVKVLNIESEGDGTWALGCRFISELSDDEMEGLLTSTNHVLSSDENKESAAEEQPPIQPKARFLNDVHVIAETPSGGVAEYLIGRLNVARSWPLTAGKVLTINGKSRSKSSWSVRIQVVQCVATSHGWEIQARHIGSAASATDNRVAKGL